METVWGKLIIFFEDPFWVGVFQRVSEGELTACKVTFGGQPRDQEIYQFVLDHYAALRYSPGVAAEQKPQAKNPKRRQRQVRKETRPTGTGTKSQQALQLQREAGKESRKAAARENQEAEKERRFALRQEKKREKRRGR